MEDIPIDISMNSVSKIFRLGLFKTKIAVEDLTFEIPSGQVVGLLGPNGSGKSTTLKMILGFLRPTSGEIQICGYRPNEKAARAYIGYLPENPRFQRFMTAHEALYYYGKLYGIMTKKLEMKIAFLLELVNLNHVAHERTNGFSKGMIQRLAMAQALVNQPRLLIFDEPMSGLDPLGRAEIRKLIWHIHEQMPTSTLFFSSHVLADVEQLCSSVILLKKGKLTRHCLITELLVPDSENYEVVAQNLLPSTRERYVKEKGARTTPLGLAVTINGSKSLVDFLTELQGAHARIVGISTHRKTLEEALFADRETTDATHSTDANQSEVQI